MKQITQLNKAVKYWLYLCATLVGMMIIIGGITRLTGSGLSMVKWLPFAILPPMDNMEWQEMFALYQKSPEFIKVNHYFNLADFKKIFWLEYIHRLLGRIIGMVFLLPYIYFLSYKKIPKNLSLQLFGIFLLGFIQGIIGWYMVKSGLVNDPSVSHYRLALHLIIGFFIFALLLLATIKQEPRNIALPKKIYILGWVLWIVILIQIITGAFVAGLDAGLIYNNFPKMSNLWIAEEVGWHNFFSDPAQVQFEHRIGALIVLISAIALYISVRHISVQNLYYLPKTAIRTASVMLWLTIGQIILGIITLIHLVPTPIASLHQVCALLIFTTSSTFLYYIYK